MVVAHDVVDVCLLSRDGVVRCRLEPSRAQSETISSGLAGENIRAICPDPLHPRRLYACSTTEVYRSDDAGESWQWLPAGGLTYREFWTMAVWTGSVRTIRPCWSDWSNATEARTT